MNALRTMRFFLVAITAVSLVECSGGGGSHSLPGTTTNSGTRRGTHVMSVGGCPTYPDGSLAVLDNRSGNIYFFDGPVSSSSSPVATITLPVVDIAEVAGMTFDPTGDLWIAYTAHVAGYAGVLEYTAPLTTGESPSINISGSNTGFNTPMGVSFNASTGNIYVADEGASAIDVFSATANGNVAPSATISGSNTGLSQPQRIKTDANYIYVQEGSSIVTFSLTASGNAYPNTLLSNSNVGATFDFDVAGDFYTSPGSEMWVYAPISGYVYGHGQYDTPSLNHDLAVDDSGFVYGLEGGGNSLYIFNPINWASSSGTMNTVTVGYQDGALAIYSPGKFNGTEPQ